MRLKLRCLNNIFVFLCRASIKSTLFLMISMHYFNSCVRCIVWLCICFTCERCYMSSINKSSTRVVANLKNVLSEQSRRHQFRNFVASLLNDQINPDFSRPNLQVQQLLLDADGSSFFSTWIIKVLLISSQARAIGTTVTVTDLFSTMPVRRKEFLRNSKREFNKMIHSVQAYCLISTNVR